MLGLVARARIMSLEYRDATLDESEALRVAPGAPLLDLSRLRLLDDRPTAIERLRMPTSRLRWPDGFDFTGSIYAALESQGIVPTVADAYVDVVDATEAEARLLGTPASIQTIPTNANNQDVVSMGCTAAKMTRATLPLLWKLVAIEALAVAQAADLHKRKDVMGGDYRTLYDLVRSISPKLETDRPLFEDIQRVTALLQSDHTQQQCLPPRGAESDAD